MKQDIVGRNRTQHMQDFNLWSWAQNIWGTCTNQQAMAQTGLFFYCNLFNIILCVFVF